MGATPHARMATEEDWTTQFHEPHEASCCAWAAYPFEDWSYWPYTHDHGAPKVPMTVADCAEQCLATEGCTGIEVQIIFAPGENLSPYCAFVSRRPLPTPPLCP